MTWQINLILLLIRKTANFIYKDGLKIGTNKFVGCYLLLVSAKNDK